MGEKAKCRPRTPKSGKERGSLRLSIWGTVLLMLGGLATPVRAECRWVGTAPWCAGECGPGETQESAASQAHMVQSLPSTNHFGNGCAVGTKAYCCKTPGVTCRWDGTAPFCAGSCEAGEKEVKRCGSCIGKVCVTGSKVKCCRQHTGSAGQPLNAGVEYARYAAIWEKESGPAMAARHGMTAAAYQQEFDRLGKEGYRLVQVSGYAVSGQDYYAAMWEKRSGPPWVARHRMTSASYQDEFDKLGKQGYRLVQVSGYAISGKDHYAAIWEKKSGPPWVARHRMTSAAYQNEFNKLAKQGYRLVQVNGYAIAGKDHYAAIWEKKPGPPWVARHRMTSAGYQKEFNKLGKQGYRLVQVSGYSIGGESRYAAIWEKRPGPAWAARQGMASPDYQEEFDHRAKEGFRLSLVNGYAHSN